MTNRELYLAIAEIIDQNKKSVPPLIDYLCALRELTLPFKDLDGISPEKFLELLSNAFSYKSSGINAAWRSSVAEDSGDMSFTGWESTIIRQIVDLQEMEEQGALLNELRYFGINSPRGNRWYNFDPIGFIECGSAGTFGGWEEGDATGREYVPGQVAVMNEDGSIVACDPHEVNEPRIELESISWESYQYFLIDGQMYE